MYSTIVTDAASAPTRTIRVLCLHGHSLNKDIFSFTVEPIKQAFKRRAPDGVSLELVHVNGLHEMSVAALEERAANDPIVAAHIQAELLAIRTFEAKSIYAWAKNNEESHDWEFFDIDDALAHVQSLLKEHAPIDGLLGMSQGGMIAQIVAAQSCKGEGAPLRFLVTGGGARPGWHKQRPDLFPAEGLPIHSFIIGGANDLAHRFSEKVDRTDPGCKGMAALVKEGFVARHTHSGGHTLLPPGKESTALAEEICDFFLDPQAVVAAYPAREEAREAAAKIAAEEKREADKKKRLGGDEGIRQLADNLGITTEAAAAMMLGDKKEAQTHESLGALLDDGGLSHLKEALIDKDGARSLDEWCSLLDASGRSECIKQLKLAGVEKLGDRQKLATLIGKARTAKG